MWLLITSQCRQHRREGALVPAKPADVPLQGRHCFCQAANEESHEDENHVASLITNEAQITLLEFVAAEVTAV
jgi:hypothetical protein